MRLTPEEIERRCGGMVEWQRAYLAGIIDGEGAIVINRSLCAKGTRHGHSLRLLISIANTKPVLIRWIHETVGFGAVHKVVIASERHAPASRWEVWSKQAAAVLRAVRPYLVIKGAHADVALEFDAAMRFPGARGLSLEERANQVRLYEALKSLNRRGR